MTDKEKGKDGTQHLMVGKRLHTSANVANELSLYQST